MNQFETFSWKHLVGNIELETRLSCAANSFGSTGSEGPQKALLALLFVKAVFDLSFLFSIGGAAGLSSFFGSIFITFCVGVFAS